MTEFTEPCLFQKQAYIFVRESQKEREAWNGKIVPMQRYRKQM